MTGSASRRKGAIYARHIRQHLEACGWEVMSRQAGEDGDDLRILDRPELSIELDRQMLDARDADIAYSNDDETEGDIDGPLYARDAEGRTVKADHRR